MIRRVTTERLLAGDPRVAQSARDIVRTADAHKLIYRMSEGNSCYRGGKPGMSNAFAASLWAADYLLTLASLGCAGVNLHGGDSRFLSAGLGDHNPGLEVAGNKQAKRAQWLLHTHFNGAGTGCRSASRLLRHAAGPGVCRRHDAIAWNRRRPEC